MNVPPTSGGPDGQERSVVRALRRLAGVVRRFWPDVALSIATLTAGSIVVALLEQVAAFDNGSSAFLLAVVVVAVARGTGPAIATAIGAFLAYDFFFIEPRLTLTVRDPAEWLNLLLLLVVGIVVGRLAGQERDRAIAAIEGEREASAMFNISFKLATERDTAAALGPIASIVQSETRASRIWLVVAEALAADTATGVSSPPITPVVHVVLRRRPGDEPAEWVRVHVPGRAGKAGQTPAESAYRVAISAGDQTYGSIWMTRPRGLGDPDPGETRVIAAAADQIGGAIERARLQRDATSAEVARRSEALKSALLDSVSHDLRTPLASIRAAAGTLMDPDVEWPAERRREIATSIDREADWLNRLVTNLLDMSRVEAGELRPNLAAFALSDLVAEALTRTTIAASGRTVTVDLPEDLPPILADEVLLGQVLVNTLDNAAKYAGPDAPVRIVARTTPERRILVTIEDGGAGVPPEAIPRLFEKFYRVPRKGEGSRRGTGIGLAVVRGLIEAMSGHVVARPSSLGGLAIEFDLPISAPERVPEVTA
jgi:two-component system, OmpR family, sensor histidine kinase KdpD